MLIQCNDETVKNILQEQMKFFYFQHKFPQHTDMHTGMHTAFHTANNKPLWRESDTNIFHCAATHANNSLKAFTCYKCDLARENTFDIHKHYCILINNIGITGWGSYNPWFQVNIGPRKTMGKMLSKAWELINLK